MKVEKSVFLEEGNKKITLFQIAPAHGLELTAQKMVHEAAMLYVMKTRVMHNKFVETDNPFTVLILEGMNNN